MDDDQQEADFGTKERIEALFRLQEELPKMSLEPTLRLLSSFTEHIIHTTAWVTGLVVLWFTAYYSIKYWHGTSILNIMGIRDEWSHVILLPMTFWFVVVGSVVSYKIFIFNRSLFSSASLSGLNLMRKIKETGEIAELGFESNARLAQHLLIELEKDKNTKDMLLKEVRRLGWQLHLLTQLTADILWSLDATGRITAVGQAIHDMTGHLAPDLLGQDFTGLATATEQKRVKTFLEGVRHGREVQRLETRWCKKDGKEVHVCLTAMATQEARIEDRCIQGSVVEITRQREIEKAVLANLPLLIDLEEKPSFLTTTATMDGILGCQLEDVITETEKAANQIAGFAHELDTSMTTLLQMLSSANARTSELGKSSQQIIDEDQQAIQDLKNFIAQAELRQKEGQERVHAAMDQVRGLQNLVQIVLEVSDHTTVLALNARIVAARAGEQGHKFTVVANEVKKLAQQTREVARQIEEGITHAAATVEEVLADHTQEGQAQNEEAMLKKSAEQMMRLGEHYRNLISFNEVTMRQMTEWNQGMSDRVVMLVGGIQFQDIVRQRVEQVINALKRRKAHADAIIDQLRNPDKVMAIEQVSVEDLFRDYVMEDQRRNHERATGGKGGSATSGPPMVELF